MGRKWWPRWRYPKAIYAIDKPYDYLVPGAGGTGTARDAGGRPFRERETVGRMASCSPWNGRRRTHPTEAGAVLSGRRSRPG